MITALEEQILDELAILADGSGSENWPPRRHGRGCACKDCLRAELASEATTAIGKITLPGSFSGWQGSTRLITILRTTRGLTPFTDNGRKLLYRIIQNDHPNYPIYIGITWGAKSSIRMRLMDHTLGRDAASRRVLQAYRTEAPEASEIKRLRQYLIKQALGGKHSRISVQWGKIENLPGHITLTPKLLHAYELTLQVLERPITLSGTSLSFD